MVTTSQSTDDLTSASKKIHFRVAIKQAEDWKIRSIAEYKKRLAEKQTKTLSLLTQASNTSSSSSTAPPVSTNVKTPVPSTAGTTTTTVTDKKANKKSKVSESQESNSNVVSAGGANDAATAVVVPPKIEITPYQKQQQLDLWLRELELISQSSAVSKERVRQLHMARSQLLWLLKKAVRHERHMIHEHLSAFATGNK